MHYEVYVDLIFLINFMMDGILLFIDSGDSEMSDYMGQALLAAGVGALVGVLMTVIYFAEFLAQEHVGVSVRRSRYDILCVSGPLFSIFCKSLYGSDDLHVFDGRNPAKRFQVSPICGNLFLVCGNGLRIWKLDGEVPGNAAGQETGDL